MIKAIVMASAMMCGTILAANAATYIAPPVPSSAAREVQPIKSVGPPPVCSEAAIRAACVKQPYASCSESYRRIHNC